MTVQHINVIATSRYVHSYQFFQAKWEAREKHDPVYRVNKNSILTLSR